MVDENKEKEKLINFIRNITTCNYCIYNDDCAESNAVHHCFKFDENTIDGVIEEMENE